MIKSCFFFLVIISSNLSWADCARGPQELSKTSELKAALEKIGGIAELEGKWTANIACSDLGCSFQTGLTGVFGHTDRGFQLSIGSMGKSVTQVMICNEANDAFVLKSVPKEYSKDEERAIRANWPGEDGERIIRESKQSKTLYRVNFKGNSIQVYSYLNSAYLSMTKTPEKVSRGNLKSKSVPEIRPIGNSPVVQ